MNRKETINFLVEQLESTIKFIYEWFKTEEENLGKLVYSVHIFLLLVLCCLIIISHLIYPVIWFQIFVFLITLAVWLQHIILHTCISSVLEMKLLGRDAPLAVDIILNMFKIPILKETRVGVTVMLSTCGVAFLGLEIIARGILYLRELGGISLWA